MGNLDPAKIAIVLLVALMVLGPEKLPGFTRQMGAWWGEFQRVRSRLQSEINGAVQQINEVASPFSQTFTSTSTGVSSFVQSVFNENSSALQSKNLAESSNLEGGSAGFQIRPPLGDFASGWGMSEAESGYEHGDPRLN